jgi:hypothetical protein
MAYDLVELDHFMHGTSLMHSVFSNPASDQKLEKEEYCSAAYVTMTQS